MNNIHDLVEKIILKLAKEHKTVSFAESCTGGRIAAAFTAVSGASDVLHGSCVAYSNEIKHLWLGVSKEILETHGAVSEPCVVQMLKGIQKMATSDYALAVSGIAGPTGGTEFKPVGTVFIGILTPYSHEVFHCNFHGSRDAVQDQSTIFAIEKLAEVLKI